MIIKNCTSKLAMKVKSLQNHEDDMRKPNLIKNLISLQQDVRRFLCFVFFLMNASQLYQLQFFIASKFHYPLILFLL